MIVRTEASTHPADPDAKTATTRECLITQAASSFFVPLMISARTVALAAGDTAIPTAAFTANIAAAKKTEAALILGPPLI